MGFDCQESGDQGDMGADCGCGFWIGDRRFQIRDFQICDVNAAGGCDIGSEGIRTAAPMAILPYRVAVFEIGWHPPCTINMR